MKFVRLSNHATNIGRYAFSGCTGLTEVEIPSSVTSIGDRAFSGCNSLTKLVVPGTINLSNYQFFSCTNIEEIELTGTGSIPNYTSSTYKYTPWYISKEKVTKIKIGN